ncbi:MAG TPA: hypothetical protein VMS81_08195 [Methanomicrobiales archaeon]|jgi:hypothetical protein|nr:hypothetical protein [Methanomicrobiales archaeon]
MIRGSPRRHLRPVILAFLILVSMAGMARSQETSTVIYSTDFSSDPDWVTNNPYTNHWDEAIGMFHYALRDSTNTFVYKKVPYNGESFELAYDLYPAKTDFQSSFRLGLGNRGMAINQATTIFSEFENGPYGEIIWIRAIDQQNQRREVSSYAQSYGGPSVRFSDGTPYHVVIQYSREQRTAGIAVKFLENGSSLWGYTLSTVSNLGLMDRIYLSTIGDFENPSAVAEGNLDNVSLRLIIPSGEPGTPSTTSSPTIVTGGGTQTVTLPVSSTPSAPVTVPTKSGIPVLVILAALAGAALLARSKVR